MTVSIPAEQVLFEAMYGSCTGSLIRRTGEFTRTSDEEGGAQGVGSTSVETEEWRKFFIPSW
ncbi:MAG TPA: hypothetical protein VKB35_09855 [Ktedonobacteraceae bacterium]|nr:hypothetical protein [Ktedonobacteraceae bacterium]